METPQLFVVRVWRGAAGFRASVRAPDEESPHWFTAASDLAAFLARPATPPSAGGSAAPATHGPGGTDDAAR